MMISKTIQIVVERDDASGQYAIKAEYDAMPIDLLYEVTKYMISRVAEAADHIQDPVTRKMTSDMMNGCKLIIKGGETSLIEFRQRQQRQG